MTAAELLAELRNPTQLTPPEHRERKLLEAVAFLKARGLTTQEIAGVLGLTVSDVMRIASTPDFHKAVFQLVTAKPQLGDTYIAGEGWNSVIMLARLRDDVNTPPQVRVKCAVELANRAFGQPRQVQESFHHQDQVPESPAEITKRINEITKELEQLERN